MGKRHPRQTRVFISYSREDAGLVKPVVQIMRAIGAEVFLDIDSIDLGQRWELIIEKSIDIAHMVFVFWCSHAQESKYVADEYTRAISLKKRIIPVLLDGTPPVGELSGYQALDYSCAVSHQLRDPGAIIEADEIEAPEIVHSNLEDIGLSAHIALGISRVVSEHATERRITT